ncbi:SAM-dependent methyltransferase [Duganella sp. BJB488]|uniref:class I SAM-dependent methyltransferase n=1 Tax=unclassified Duganella TaxID=2636909 RepID=UPI000E34BBC7|nr:MULTISPECIES: class I SAM-dependent methyltransferase [unclassified Duganella]RFP21510.1 SAM-dependent methyltransferase [Duganella sp. BJB489]RFP23302.1 SAM-dependent methyltransferase [Duganella sp. BJB488]RFP38466.1 SAM-dependent methyltransferase [Duganella sp. BJB480]
MKQASTGKGLLQQGVASRSALAVAMLRAAHQLIDKPLVFDDPLALSILGPENEAVVRAAPQKFDSGVVRVLRAAMAVRSRFAEDELARALDNGVRQFVLLGAGLDSYAYRNPVPDLRVFEVDHPATQRWKRGLLEQAGIAAPESLTYVPVDFERDDLADALMAAGCRLDQPVFFSWLGVTLYLSTDAVFDTLAFVAGLPSGSGIVFDYGVVPELLNPMERMGMSYFAQKYEAEGEPWISYFAPEVLACELRAMGYGAVSDHGADQLRARYLASRNDGLRLGGGTRLMSAQVSLTRNRVD